MPASKFHLRPAAFCGRAFVLFLCGAAHFLLPVLRAQLPDDGSTVQEPRALGLREPTADETAWMDLHMQKTKGVRLNELGLSRVNRDRREKNLTELAVAVTVPAGQEPVSAEAVASGDGGKYVMAGTTTGVALPSAVDNSTLPSFPPVGNQGSIGSCAAFSTTYYAATHMTGLVRGWTNNNADLTQKFSPKWTYNFANGGADNGTWFTSVFDVLLKLGAATWSDWPYNGTNTSTNYLEWPLSASVWRNAVNYRFSDVGRVQNLDTGTGLAAAKAMLNNGYVLLYATDIYAWRFTTFSNDPATNADNAFVGQPVCRVVKDFTRVYNGQGSGHAMTIVGYNDDVWTDINKNGVVDPGEKGAFKIVNQWGTNWGVPGDTGSYTSVTTNGYAWIAYDALRATSAVPTTATETYFSTDRAGGTYSYRTAFWGQEIYWISARASYTPTLLGQFTLSHAQRSQLQLRLGRSATTATVPATYWPVTTTSYNGWASTSGLQVFQNLGGSYAFNGTFTAVSGTFVFDCTDLATAGNQRYYLEVGDNASGSAASVSDFRLVN
ncbi:MAG: C1 family peptidase, partial [Pseudomonadota bacterium]